MIYEFCRFIVSLEKWGGCSQIRHAMDVVENESTAMQHAHSRNDHIFASRAFFLLCLTVRGIHHQLYSELRFRQLHPPLIPASTILRLN